MAGIALFFVHYALLLLFGIVLSLAFTGVQVSTKRNLIVIAIVFAALGLTQVAAFLLFDELQVWKLYPLITHLPLVVLLCLYYHKQPATGLAAVSTVYLCCQPANWLGILVETLMNNQALSEFVQIVVLLAVGYIALRQLAPYLSEIFSKDARNVWFFGSIPMIYYLFDYVTGVYTDLWTTHYRTVSEFIPFLLCIVFTAFCIVYYKEFEQKLEAKNKEQIVRITAEQQTREIEAVKKSEQEIRLLRHDMRLLLNSLAVCIENGKSEQAQEMIAAYTSHVEGTKLERFCANETVNYVLSHFAAKCHAEHVAFSHTVEIGELKVDDILFASILSNALDNALNAQSVLPESKRNVKLMLKDSDGRLLLSVKNPVKDKPEFRDGLPVTSRKDHGYGTQSIRYMAERLGGNCQFLCQDDLFIVRVIL